MECNKINQHKVFFNCKFQAVDLTFQFENYILQKIQKYLRRIHNFFITNKLSLQLEALSNCDNFTVITILYNNDVLTWDYKDNNKYQVTMS